MSANVIPAYGRNVSVRAVRRVWAAVSIDPQASIDELTARLPICRSTIVRALKVLQDAGAIVQPYRGARSRTVTLAFVEVSR